MLIIHTADIHLDHAFSAAEARAGIAGLRREELRVAVCRVMDAAVAHHAEAVTIAGDLFEAERVTSDTIEFLRATFERASPLKVLIAPGNRDPYGPQSPYRHTDWSENVHIFTDPEPRPYPLSEGVVIWGVAHTGPAGRSNPIEGFRAPDEGTNVLLLHSSLTDRPLDEGARLAPLSSDDVRAANARFALLGHNHRPQIFPGGDPRVAYPGSPEPLSARDGISHGCLPVSIDDGRVSVGFLPMASRRYVEVKLDLKVAYDREDLRARIEEQADVSAEEAKRIILRVRLTGCIKAGFDFDLRELEMRLARRYGAAEVVCEATGTAGTEFMSEEDTPRGEFVRRLLAQKPEGPAGVRRLARALSIGLRELDGGGDPTF